MWHRYSANALWLVKWPVALVFLAYLPAAAAALLTQALVLLGHLPQQVNFLGSGSGYFLLWLLILRKIPLSFLSTLEHELTHGLFALLTFNRITKIRATLNRGGAISYKGTANWLILLAPYFCPTVSIVVLLFGLIVNPSWHWLMDSLLGVSVAYHLTTTWCQTHSRQTDFRDAGYIFSTVFLPTANLLAYAAILAVHQHGAAGLTGLFQDLRTSGLRPGPFIQWALHLWSRSTP